MATTKKKVPLTRDKAERMIAGALHQLPEEFLACRDLRHAWKVQDNFHDGNTEGTTMRVLKCVSCETVRTDVYSVLKRPGMVPRMEKVSSAYTYPKGYQMRQPSGVRDLAISQLVKYETFLRVLNATKKSS